MTSAWTAGWYPDQARGGFSYWDGNAWTGQWHPPQPQTQNLQPWAPPVQQQAIASYPVAYSPAAPAPLTYGAPAKSAGVAVFLSFLWPGLGHLYVGSIGVGLVLGFVNLFLFPLTLVFIFPGLLALGLWIAGMVMAANAAADYNHRSQGASY